MAQRYRLLYLTKVNNLLFHVQGLNHMAERSESGDKCSNGEASCVVPLPFCSLTIRWSCRESLQSTWIRYMVWWRTTTPASFSRECEGGKGGRNVTDFRGVTKIFFCESCFRLVTTRVWQVLDENLFFNFCFWFVLFFCRKTYGTFLHKLTNHNILDVLPHRRF